MSTTIKTSNCNLPAPKYWRKLEDALLMLIIPATVAVLMGWGFKDEAFLNKILLLVNTLLVAVIKAIGMVLANGQVYASKDEIIGGGQVPPKKDEK